MNAQWVAAFMRQNSTKPLAMLVGLLTGHGFSSEDIAAGFAKYVEA